MSPRTRYPTQNFVSVDKSLNAMHVEFRQLYWEAPCRKQLTCPKPNRPRQGLRSEKGRHEDVDKGMSAVIDFGPCRVFGHLKWPRNLQRDIPAPGKSSVHVGLLNRAQIRISTSGLRVRLRAFGHMAPKCAVLFAHECRKGQGILQRPMPGIKPQFNGPLIFLAGGSRGYERCLARLQP